MRRRRRRRFRRNPPAGRGMFGGVGRLFFNGATLAAGNLAGDAIVNAVSNAVPQLGASPMMKRGSKAGLAVLVSTFGRRFLGGALAEKLAEGMLSGVFADFGRDMLVNVGLGAYVDEPMGAYVDGPQLAGYMPHPGFGGQIVEDEEYDEAFSN